MISPAGSAGFWVMGIVNVTPDSFSDGGRYLDTGAAVAHGLELAAEGADVLDVGGESTRPGAVAVGEAEELRRVVPVIEGLCSAASGSSGSSGSSGGSGGSGSVSFSFSVSVDTSKATVAAAAVAAGARLVNDVTALRGDPRMAEVVADGQVDVCLMHMLGEPRTMQENPRYEDVVSDVKAFLEERVGFAVAAGVAEERIVLDPGIGFGKTMEHNLELLRRLDEIVALGRPVLIGVSRKTFLGRITGRDVGERLAATIAANVMAFERGARIFRVHEVAPVLDALKVTAATLR